MIAILLLVLFNLFSNSSGFITHLTRSTHSKLLSKVPTIIRTSICMMASSTVPSIIPEGILVDVLQFDKATDSTASPVCNMNEAADLGKIMKEHTKAVLFAVPGAFTPTCSAQHLPGFIANIEALKAKGVDAVYCLSVNDRFVMRAWAENTPGCISSGIRMVADGSCMYTTALNMIKDASSSRMGLRSKRYAAIIEHGIIKHLNVDEKGMVASSAEEILKLL